MIPALNSPEIRVLACLVEKAMTTPDYYPLTLNALASACNQKSNRNPVVDFDEKSIVRTLDALRDHKLVWVVTSNATRVPKYEHRFDQAFSLSRAEAAILCELMLRGPQTSGELRSRSARMHVSDTIAEVETLLGDLQARETGPLVTRLPRQSGQKECRFMHLLGGEPEIPESDGTAPPEPARLEVEAENARIARLENDVRQLTADIVAIRQEFATFRQQFE